MLFYSVKEEIERRRIEKRNRALEAQKQRVSFIREAEYRAGADCKTKQAEYAYYQHKKNLAQKGSRCHSMVIFERKPYSPKSREAELLDRIEQLEREKSDL